MTEYDNLRAQLQAALTECARLRCENNHLKALLGMPPDRAPDKSRQTVNPPLHEAPPVDERSSRQAKIALFRNLFRGRDDVYAVRWQSKDGRTGYSPAYQPAWDRRRRDKPRMKFADYPPDAFRPLTDQAMRDHLTGKQTVGIYPLLTDETCWFLAADFDQTTWQEDAAAFLAACDELGVPAALERSRSGNGGHIWVFFERPLPAAQARRLGCAILTRTMERRHQIGLDSYDRFFPNQDTMPAGGFGNLIALPLQRDPRNQGNTVFLDRSFAPYPDQWAFLASIRKMSPDAVDAIVQSAMQDGSLIGVRISLTESDDDPDPWTLPPSRRQPERPLTGPFPDRIAITLGNLIYLSKEGLPAAMLNRLIRLAAFQNPEFYRAQARRLSTFGKPRIIACAEDFPRYIGLPRGCLDEALHLLESHGIQTELLDERFAGAPIAVTFQGELTPLQQEAVQGLLAHDIGVLSATTAFGKTVVGAWLVAARKTNTLILVHRRQLMDQWRARLAAWLNLPPDAIGQLGAGKTRPTGQIDIAMLQSLNRKGEVSDRVAEYGQVIVDECHHVSAFSFEQILKQVKARYVTGLTATPVRKDGHHPIIIMQCGPIRFRVDAKQQAAARPFEHVVVARRTDFRLPAADQDPSIQQIYGLVMADERRNERICSDVVQAVKGGRSPLVLTERTKHVAELARRLQGVVQHVVVLRGGMGAKQRRAVAEQLASIAEDEERVLIATGRYIGEGFDDARLDTLFLAMPISWRGTLHQYAGRLHRLHASKREVRVVDYVDQHVPILQRMYERRLKGYEGIGYAVRGDDPVLGQMVLM